VYAGQTDKPLRLCDLSGKNFISVCMPAGGKQIQSQCHRWASTTWPQRLCVPWIFRVTLVIVSAPRSYGSE